MFLYKMLRWFSSLLNKLRLVHCPRPCQSALKVCVVGGVDKPIVIITLHSVELSWVELSWEYGCLHEPSFNGIDYIRFVYMDLLLTGIAYIIVFWQNKIDRKKLNSKVLGTLNTLTAKISRPRGGPKNKFA